ncbi:hypothetical protein J2T14_003316 [Paenibacillus harenae]|nr:hypothetical protein [Paenibacillus harenae]
MAVEHLRTDRLTYNENIAKIVWIVNRIGRDQENDAEEDLRVNHSRKTV